VGYQWDFTNLTWNLPTSPAAYAYDVSGFVSLNNSQIGNLVGHILQNYSSVCGLTFTYTNNEAAANIRYAEAFAVDTTGQGLEQIPTALGVPPDPQFLAAAQGDAGSPAN